MNNEMGKVGKIAKNDQIGNDRSMSGKPEIGILFFTSGWFRDVGLQESGSPLTEEINLIAKEIIERLSRFIEPVYEGILFTEQEAEAAADRISASRVDGVIVSTLVWCEDQIVRAALTKLPGSLKHAMLVCTFFPEPTLPGFVTFGEMLKGSGVVGSLQISGCLKREGYTYRALSGYYRDSTLYQDIRDHCMSFAVARRLRNAKCGVLPFRCEHISATYVDEFKLRTLYGVRLTYLELQSVKKEAGLISGEEIAAFRELLTDKGYGIEVDDKNFAEGARYALTLERVLARENLEILAMNDITGEMHQCFGLRPCLDNPQLAESGAVIAMEADIPAGIAMYILRSFTGEPPFYTEIFTADLEKNVLLMGHAGYHDSANHDSAYPVKVIPDIEYKNSDTYSGACTYFKYKAGPVTAVNSVYNGEKLRWTVFEGTSLSGKPGMEGNCHLLCEIDLPVNEFLRKAIELGVSQHWIVISGIHAKRLSTLCGWLNIEYCRL